MSMTCAPAGAMAHNLDKLDVYHKSIAAAGAVSDIVKRQSFGWDRRLREQLGSASESVASLISEGSEQSTDRHFAEYCHRAKGSAREIRTQLTIAAQRDHITEAERAALDSRYEEIGKMLNGLIDHLLRRAPDKR